MVFALQMPPPASAVCLQHCWAELIHSVQSNDLVETAAQRTASVSPANFKSALSTSRRLLASTANIAGPSSTRKRRADAPTQTAPVPSVQLPPLPFSTPRKKYKSTTNVDISALMTPSHKHSPRDSSPLRENYTPGSSQPTPSKLRPMEEEDEDDEVDEGQDNTPRKRKGAVDDGDDTERTPTKSVQSRLNAARRAREADGAAAFLALRPGTTPSAALAGAGAGAGATGSGASPHGADLHQSDPMNVFRVPSPQRMRRLRKRADWTSKEKVWSKKSSESVWAKLHIDVEGGRDPVAASVEDIILAAWP